MVRVGSPSPYMLGKGHHLRPKNHYFLACDVTSSIIISQHQKNSNFFISIHIQSFYHNIILLAPYSGCSLKSMSTFYACFISSVGVIVMSVITTFRIVYSNRIIKIRAEKPAIARHQV